MEKYWTADFEEFKKKIAFLGDLDKLAKVCPEGYAHHVLSHGYMEYAGIKMIKYTKENYLNWAKENNLTLLLEEGWQAFLDD